ncbi:MAG TPA: hypothetical protein DCQ33_06270 [Nitrospira sp.]|nr:hypothetical protein [Nitrospira sp.]
MKEYRKTILIISAWLAFMIASVGFFAVYPPLARATEPVLCSGGEISRATPDRRRAAFQCTRAGKTTPLNPFHLLGVGTLVYFPPILVAMMLLYHFYVIPKYKGLKETS